MFFKDFFMIGRRKEIKELNSLCESKRSHLAVIYGRRRIGKTYLVDYMFRERRRDCLFFEFTGSENQDAVDQRTNFIEAIYDWFRVEPSKEIGTWTEAFIFLKRAINQEIERREHQGKVVLFFDKISWIDKFNKAKFLSAFGHFYNTFCKKSDKFLVILCGSNASWIKNKILKDSRGPLYQRVDKEIPMFPFTLQETKEYLLKEKAFDIDHKSVTEIYMVLGGVAKYLDLLDASLSVAQNMDNLFFKLHAPLYEEYDAIFKSLFYNKTMYHKKIVSKLCEKQSGYTVVELADALGSLEVSDRVLRNTLDELVNTGFIKPIGRVHNKKKESKYVIADPFSLFYNRWVSPLSKNDIALFKDYYNSHINTQGYVSWSGYAFELIVMINIEAYLHVRGLRGVYKSVRYWNHIAQNSSERGAQIDLLVEYENNLYDVVECKFLNSEFVLDASESEKMKNRVEMFKKYALKVKTKYDIKLVIVTTYGVKVNKYYNQLNIADAITLDDLVV
jgi:AAA+ ATPase superfamily predicted ATPase